jgi:hypothetical protein
MYVVPNSKRVSARSFVLMYVLVSTDVFPQKTVVLYPSVISRGCRGGVYDEKGILPCFVSILGRGHSAPTVTELIFVRAQRLNHFAIKAIYALCNNNWINLKAIYALWNNNLI